MPPPTFRLGRPASGRLIEYLATSDATYSPAEPPTDRTTIQTRPLAPRPVPYDPRSAPEDQQPTSSQSFNPQDGQRDHLLVPADALGPTPTQVEQDLVISRLICGISTPSPTRPVFRTVRA